MTVEYVDYNKAVAKEMWDHVSVNFDCFKPIRALRDGIAIIGIVDIDAAYELTNTCAVNIVVLECEIQVDPENQQLNLMAGLNISPELRAILTIKASRALSAEITDAIEKCADWVEATADAPDGFIGETFELPSEETLKHREMEDLEQEELDSDELIEETGEPDPFESDLSDLNVAEVHPAVREANPSEDNPY